MQILGFDVAKNTKIQEIRAASASAAQNLE
jgi:hypothetical protein